MKRPVLEKSVQQQIVTALRTIGAKVYVIGRPPRRDAVHKGTGIGVGLPDLLVHLPAAPGRTGWEAACQLWIEVKAKGGRLSPEQATFRDFCLQADIAHIWGDLDAVIAWLLAHGYLRPDSVAHYRLPKAVAS